MSDFSIYSLYFKSAEFYQSTFQNVFSVSPYSYPVNLGVNYYDKYRAVSISVLGSLDLVLDNDMYGYSPNFYFNPCSLKSLFPVQVLFVPHSYLNFRLVLPYKFYRNYSIFINKFTRFNFTNISFFTYNSNPAIFFFPSGFFNRYSIFRSFLYRKKYFKKERAKGSRFRRFKRHYVRFFKRTKVTKSFMTRVFETSGLASSFRVIFRNGLSLLSFKPNSRGVPVFFIPNRAFSPSQFFVPLIQRMIKFIFRIGRKAIIQEFSVFYLQFRDIVFSKFFRVLRRFLKGAFKKLNNVRVQLTEMVFFSVSQYTSFAYSKVVSFKPFFSALIFSLIRLNDCYTVFDQQVYYDFVVSHSVNLVSWLRFSILINQFPFLSNVFDFKVLAKSAFWQSKLVMQFSKYKFFFYFFFSLFYSYFNSVDSRYSFKYVLFFNKFFNINTNFKLSLLFKSGLSQFFHKLNSANFVFNYTVRNLSFFSTDESRSLGFANTFSKYFIPHVNVYAIGKPKRNFSKKLRLKARKKKVFLRFYSV